MPVPPLNHGAVAVVLEPVSREAQELLELAEWDAHLAYDFARKGLVVAHLEDRARYQRIIDELRRLSAAAENRQTRPSSRYVAQAVPRDPTLVTGLQD